MKGAVFVPPKAKITREMIIDAAFDIAREEGAENINARKISTRLKCSTQPVLYHFSTVGEIRAEVYKKADGFHSEYLMSFRSENPMLDIGMNYVRFGAKEKNLFRLLFQSNEFSGKNMSELLASPELTPIMEVLSEEAEVSAEQARTIFTTLFLFVHGYASMLANNSIKYDEEGISKDLEQVFTGAVLASRSEDEA